MYAELIASNKAIKLVEDSKQDHIIVEGQENLYPVLAIMKKEYAFQVLSTLTATHEKDTLRLFYFLTSYSRDTSLLVEIAIKTEEPRITTVSSLWKSAEWLEREVYDLFGIEFVGNSNLKRILMPDDWEGFPLRKDYVRPDFYGDIDNRRSTISKDFD